VKQSLKKQPTSKQDTIPKPDFIGVNSRRTF